MIPCESSTDVKRACCTWDTLYLLHIRYTYVQFIDANAHTWFIVRDMHMWVVPALTSASLMCNSSCVFARSCTSVYICMYVLYIFRCTHVYVIYIVIYVNVYVYIYMYNVYIHVYTFMCECVFALVYKCIHSHVCAYNILHSDVYVYVHLYVHLYASAYLRARINMYTFTSVCVWYSELWRVSICVTHINSYTIDWHEIFIYNLILHNIRHRFVYGV